MSKRYEILTSLPVYGPMYIAITNNEEPFYSQGFAVRFYKSDGTQWVANFKPGWTELTEMIQLEGVADLLVIAYGFCYIIDPEQTKPLSTFGISYSETFKTRDGRIILQDQTDLTIVESDGTHWDTERISWDGLEGLELNGNIVSGRACHPSHDDDDWIFFTYNIDTRKLIGGSYP